MAFEFKTGTKLTLKISRVIARDSARKTIERLFMQDKAVHRPIDIRARNFKALPKRRGGQIWTKWPNKVHPKLMPGDQAVVKSTPQTLLDLESVKAYLAVSAA